jgi:hypothetical protein
MSRRVPHRVRKRRSITFYQVKHVCQHLSLHALWTRTKQEEAEARAQCEQLAARLCPPCQQGADTKGENDGQSPHDLNPSL